MTNPTAYTTPIKKAICNKIFPINSHILFSFMQGNKERTKILSLFAFYFSLSFSFVQRSKPWIQRSCLQSRCLPCSRSP